MKTIPTLLISILISTSAFSQINTLMPVPASVTPQTGKFNLNSTFSVSVSGNPDPRLTKAIHRFLKRLSKKTTLTFDPDTVIKSNENTTFTLSVDRPGLVRLGEDESYALSISPSAISLSAPTDLGALHGLETLYQLIERDGSGFFFRSVQIKDQPRFPWRGLMLDVCRHFFKVETVKRQLDAMALVKLNVLHLHLSEDQGFSIESKTFPKLHELGSNGNYFTQDQIRDIIAYAADRGIRVMPEFDIPGHTTSWMTGYPELASAPGFIKPEKRFGIFGSTMNPAKPETYTFLDQFFAEMCALFPDEYMHIGGDENNGEQWDANQEIQKFKSENNLKTNHDLQAYFNLKILDILTKNGKKMMGWDEIYQPTLPKNIVIHSWRGRDYMDDAAKAGFQSVLSNGFYIDLFHSAAEHYQNDPIPTGTKLTDDEKSRILGGEATQWAELVDEETLDMRIWPRTAAIAERLWSSGSVINVDDMYRRLPEISLRLEEIGLNLVTNRDVMMRRLAGSDTISDLRNFLNAVEPQEGYKRHSIKPGYTTFSPFSRGVDIALSDAPDVISASLLVNSMIKSGNRNPDKKLFELAEIWISSKKKLTRMAENNIAIKELLPVSNQVSELGRLFKSLLEKYKSGKTLTKQELQKIEAEVKLRTKPVAELEPAMGSVILTLAKKMTPGR
ncbi:MAG: family 20 glycosylhydrolase [Bacteroidetes bacterium]|nr:family 20 glycosylhydrolase [Bacteroidota bacterium]